MSFVPHTDDERRQMLEAIGVSQLADLFGDVPATVRFPDLNLPPALSEMEVAALLRQLAVANTPVTEVPSFLGAGSYRHFIPATVDYVLQRGEFYTAYTPYQPEMSQGMLQAMFEYQSMICRLTGMEVSNASHYDGATSLAEGVLLALEAGSDDRQRIVISPSVHPNYREVVETYLTGTDAALHIPEEPAITAAQLVAEIDDQTTALVVQTPDFFGRIEDLRGLADAVHERGALLIVMTDPIALGLFRPPGADGADVVVADGQPLGISPSFGGPSLGIFATKRRYIRRLAGRLVGETVDTEGQRGYVLTLATREQHIRRAKATSNICTNSALGALAAATYLATMGEQGLRGVAELCFHKSHYAAEALAAIPGLRLDPVMNSRPFFKEFALALPQPAAAVNARLWQDHGIVGGYDLGLTYPAMADRMLIAVTETTPRGEINRLAEAMRAIVQ